MREARKKQSVKPRSDKQGGSGSLHNSRQQDRQKKGKKAAVIAILCVIILAVAAAAVVWWLKNREESFERSTLVINQDGSLTEKLKEDFPAEYSEADLKKKIESEIETVYQLGDKTAKIELQKLEVSKEQVYVQLSYPRLDDYKLFYSVALYNGEVNDAVLSQYTDLTQQLSAYRGKKAAILYQPIDVRVPGKIIAVSTGFEQDGDHLAVLKKEAVAPQYVIYE